MLDPAKIVSLKIDKCNDMKLKELLVELQLITHN